MFFFFQAEDGIRDYKVTGVQTCALPIFAAYLLAETVHASGVLAVVVAGLILSQVGPRIGVAEGRRQTDAFWSLSTFLLNASLFVLVGTEFPAAVRGLYSTDLMMGILAVLAVSAL